MDPFQLRMMTFPLLLFGKQRKWWMNEGDGKITIWEELVNKIFSKFYPLSCASNYDKMCVDDEEGLDLLEFITWRNSKFKDHKKVDETTKRALLYSWIEVGNNEGLMDEDISSDDDKDQTNSSMITKPEIKIDAQDGKDIYEIIDRDYSPIPIPSYHDISNPEELCQTEEFTVVQYSVGSCEEYITVGPSKISTVEKTLAACLESTTNSSIRKTRMCHSTQQIKSNEKRKKLNLTTK
ncbi:hypothetical protein Tco_0424963 [Tanacetum coccineum]